MGADNWGRCPQCKINDEKALQKRISETEKAYGKVPLDKFEQMRDDLRKPAKLNLETLREDYEIGIGEDGKFYAIYSGSCDKCGFSFKFRHEEQRELKP